MVNFVICDDNNAHTLYIKGLIDKNCEEKHNIFYAKTKSDIYKLLESYRRAIVFMDIVFEDSEENGIDMIKEICVSYPDMVVIFMSGYSDYYESVYETEHIYFLQKPFNERHFSNALKKALNRANAAAESDSLLINTKKSSVKLQYRDIFYIESSAHNVNIVLSDDYYTIPSMKLSDIENRLGASVFARCHQSYIVNLSKISKIEKQTILLENGKNIPISKRYLSRIKDLFTLHLGDEL